MADSKELNKAINEITVDKEPCKEACATLSPIIEKINNVETSHVEAVKCANLRPYNPVSEIKPSKITAEYKKATDRLKKLFGL